MWRIEFTSAEFLPLLPEEAQGNPGVYGFELAWWLAQALVQAGIVTSYPLGEDWGWLIEHVAGDGAEYTIGCASMAEEGEGYRGEAVQWSVFVRPHVSLKQRLKGISHEAGAQRLGAAIVAALKGRNIVVSQAEG